MNKWKEWLNLEWRKARKTPAIKSPCMVERAIAVKRKINESSERKFLKDEWEILELEPAYSMESSSLCVRPFPQILLGW